MRRSSRRRAVAIAVGLNVAACAQFKPPRDRGGESGESGGGGGSAACRVQGFVYTYADEAGSTIAEEDEVLRMKGTLARGGDVYAGVGLVFHEPKAPHDASRHQGLAFRAKRSAGSTAFLRLKVPDASTDPAGGVCTECYNDFGIPFQVTEEWTRYEVRFADLVQEAGWGAPRPPAIDAAKLYGVQWQVGTAGTEFDISIDDVSFLGCE